MWVAYVRFVLFFYNQAGSLTHTFIKNDSLQTVSPEVLGCAGWQSRHDQLNQDQKALVDPKNHFLRLDNNFGWDWVAVVRIGLFNGVGVNASDHQYHDNYRVANRTSQIFVLQKNTVQSVDAVLVS